MKLSRWLLVLVLSLSIGAHWAVLQTVAWCGMAITYSENSSLAEGLSKTFDAQHPCKLCKLVAEGKKSEKRQDAQLKIAKVDLCLPVRMPRLHLPPLSPALLTAATAFSDRSSPPSVPPPRPV